MTASRRVLVTRAAAQAAPTVAALRKVGLDPVLVPAIEIDLAPAGSDIDSAARWLPSYRWVVITSPNGARAILKAAERVFTPFEASRFAAIGSATRSALEVEGVDVEFEPSLSTAASLATELPVASGDRVLVVRGDLAGDNVATTLRQRGALVDDVVGYSTREAPSASVRLLRDALEAGPFAAIVFTSGSTVRGLVALGAGAHIDVRDVPAICIGPQTAAAAGGVGFKVAAVAPDPNPRAVARMTASVVVRQPREIR